MTQAWAAIVSLCLLTAGPTAHAAWVYSTDSDKMGRGTTTFAVTTSLNKLHFRFPYNGGSTGRLWLRRGLPRNAVMVDVSKGQFLCGYSDCAVTLKFDQEKPARWEAARPSDGTSDTIFIVNYTGFVAKAKKAKQVLIEAEFFHHGREVLEFDLTGLDWKP